MRENLMAIQTKLYSRLSANSAVQLKVFMEYDDADFRVESNDDGEHDDFRVIRWFGTNYSAYDKTIELFRDDGSVWRSATIPAGESYSVNAGGSVKYESDIPRWVYR